MFLWGVHAKADDVPLPSCCHDLMQGHQRNAPMPDGFVMMQEMEDMVDAAIKQGVACDTGDVMNGCR